MSQVICVHSFRGGTGKSSLTASLAVLLASAGMRVAVVDTYIQAPGVHVLFNLDESEIVLSLNDYLWRKCGIKDTAYDVTERLDAEISGRVFLVPSSTKAGEIARMLREGYDAGLLKNGLSGLIKELNLDFLMIDTHPGVNEETLFSLAVSNTLIIIMRPDSQDYLGTRITFDIARKLGLSRIMLIVNNIPDTFNLEHIHRNVDKLFKCEIAAMLPHSDAMMELASSGIFSLRYPDNPLTHGLQEVVEKILTHQKNDVDIAT